MGTKCIYECDGCFEKATSERLERRFVSVTGKSHGFGLYHYPTAQDVAPEGWVAFDPYTGCTYCPKCWDEIENGTKGATA